MHSKAALTAGRCLDDKGNCPSETRAGQSPRVNMQLRMPTFNSFPDRRGYMEKGLVHNHSETQPLVPGFPKEK